MRVGKKEKDLMKTVIGVRMKGSDKDRLQEKADNVGLDISTYIRYIALKSIND